MRYACKLHNTYVLTNQQQLAYVRTCVYVDREYISTHKETHQAYSAEKQRCKLVLDHVHVGGGAGKRSHRPSRAGAVYPAKSQPRIGFVDEMANKKPPIIQ